MNLRRFRALTAFTLLAGLTGCDSTPTSTGLPPTDPAKVALLRHPPARAYAELGTLKDEEIYVPAESRASNAAMESNVDPREVIRQKAAQLGADAVINVEDGVIPPLDPSTPTIHRWAKGTAIHFKTETAQNVSPPPPPPGP